MFRPFSLACRWLSLCSHGILPVCVCLCPDFIFKKKLFIYFWLLWVFVASCRLFFSVVASGGYCFLQSVGSFSLQWLLLLWSTGSRAHGFQQLWRSGLVAPQHVESPQSRDQTCFPSHWQVDSRPLDHQGHPKISLIRLSVILGRINLMISTDYICQELISK